ncbi:hypothetical protein O7598_14865 [Micromonospora sp. WMMC241]|uniref:hypothetical protein n=1 Tax=Micromonospora sp. WMMC241 TaxID=3015159 RepID=UPI0022B7491D|nr:hypothetical protein [Micromonospora sp. WMMC241]MCZ7437686.1 hypothetical protein [Micromonospora sp. WMMC241]
MTSWPRLDDWAEVDPARHPFDAAEAADVVRRLAPPVPPAAPVPHPRRHFDEADWAASREADRVAYEWNSAVTDALMGHYGSWAYSWHWGPRRHWYYFSPIVTSPPETLALVAAALVDWRRWLEEVAERFDRLLPALREATLTGPDEAVAAWESALAELLTTSSAWAEDADGWWGPCSRLLTWLLTAAGLPEDRSVALVGEALAPWSMTYAYLSAADVADVAERIAREVVGPEARTLAPGETGDDWPDTWPHDWPSWRATNRPSPPRR